MFRIHLELRMLFLCSIFLAHQSLGGRLHRTNQEENIGVSSKFFSIEAKASSPQDMDPNFNSSHIRLSSIQMPYGQALTSENDGDIEAYFSVYNTKPRDNGYYGVIATMDVYGYDLNGGQLTTGAIWVTNFEGDFSHNLNTIIVGWVVWPSRFHDSQTYLFTVWTKDTHRSTGCVNLDCPGLQLVSGSPIFPGDIITPVSKINGTRQNITIKVFKDKSSGNWWLHCGVNSDPIPIGYFPASLFDSLSVKASQIVVGGHVRNTKTAIPPPMGSGAFASDSNMAAVVRDIQLINEDGESIPIDSDMPAIVTDDKLYSVSPIAGAKFSYGGPGRNSI